MAVIRRPGAVGFLAACLVALTVGAAGCAGDSTPSPAAPSATATAAAPTPSASEDGCARVVSAIGFAEFLLVPKGKENQQVFDDGARGRLAYVEGTVVLFGKYLPADLRGQGQTLARAAKRAADKKISQADRVEALREYRKTADELIAACKARTPG